LRRRFAGTRCRVARCWPERRGCLVDFHARETPPSSVKLACLYKPYIDTCIAAFGPDRGMFESNFPPDGVNSSYAVLRNAFKRLAANFSAEEKAKPLNHTAKRAYRLA
jgi:L-fuconolactonase